MNDIARHIKKALTAEFGGKAVSVQMLGVLIQAEVRVKTGATDEQVAEAKQKAEQLAFSASEWARLDPKRLQIIITKTLA